MKIPYPPKTENGLDQFLFSCIEGLITYFDEGEGTTFRKKKFSDYISQLGWMPRSLYGIDKLLNIGCSYGRETFALMWHLHPKKAIGIDKQQAKIDYVLCNPISHFTLLTEYIHQYLEWPSSQGWSYDYVQQLINWWNNKIPENIRISVETGYIPEYISADISTKGEVVSLGANYDLIYACNVFDEIISSEIDLLNAISNICALLNPKNGQLIIVGASKRDIGENKHSRAFISINDVRQLCKESGLEEIEEIKTTQLGYLDWEKTKPIGYRFRKG